jgi:type III secretion protein J
MVRLAVVFALSVAACQDVCVLEGANETEASRAVVALSRAGLGAERSREDALGTNTTFRVCVARDAVSQALRVLATNEIPRREEPGFAEVYGSRGLVAGADEDRARAAQALAGELARTLEAIDGVVDARVHLALPDTRDVSGDAPVLRPSASVMVKYTGDRPPYDEPDVRRLVAGAVQGMRPEDVSVVGVRKAPERALTSSVTVPFLGIHVVPGDVPRLRSILSVAVVFVTGSVLAALYLWRKRRPA